jgi:hypothetical protein
MAKTPVLGLVISTIVQGLFVDDFRFRGGSTVPLEMWQANNMDAKQIRLYRSAATFGHAYAVSLRGVTDFGEPVSKIRAVSPRNMLAVYRDPADDEWPEYAFEVVKSGSALLGTVMDDEHLYYVGFEDGRWRFIEWRAHGTGVTPVVRYPYRLDLEGRTESAIEPLIAVASRVNKTVYDRLLTQHFNSWKVRTIAGLRNFASDDEEATVKKMKLRHEDMLVAEDPDTKFGTLPETPLTGFGEAYKSDMGTLAALAQIPITSLDGSISNISADGIAELRAGLEQSRHETKVGFGNANTQLVRLSARQAGDHESAADFTAEAQWKDLSVRTMSATIDALGKAATMLRIPVEKLWAMVPGINPADAKTWQPEPATTTASERTT